MHSGNIFHLYAWFLLLRHMKEHNISQYAEDISHQIINKIYLLFFTIPKIHEYSFKEIC